jgi:hypothetical protein
METEGHCKPCVSFQLPDETFLNSLEGLLYDNPKTNCRELVIVPGMTILAISKDQCVNWGIFSDITDTNKVTFFDDGGKLPPVVQSKVQDFMARHGIKVSKDGTISKNIAECDYCGGTSGYGESGPCPRCKDSGLVFKPTELYYLQDSRTYVGNAMLWWRKGNRGYCCDIDEAETYTLDQLKDMNPRDTDIPWRKEYIDKRLSKTCDMQKVDKEFALNLNPKKKNKKCKKTV